MMRKNRSKNIYSHFYLFFLIELRFTDSIIKGLVIKNSKV